MFPTLLAAAGDNTAKEDLLKGKKAGDMTFKVHIDGYNLLTAFKGGIEWEWPGIGQPGCGPRTYAHVGCGNNAQM